MIFYFTLNEERYSDFYECTHTDCDHCLVRFQCYTSKEVAIPARSGDISGESRINEKHLERVLKLPAGTVKHIPGYGV